ncbi:hypothetical protein ACUIJQ_08410 [Levilactobacillus hammesii]|uniref:hypothetical protein n=1 Tax=Levilactobacillus hammesii TaxID=267633 RepID=UPI00070AA690|nr:hypothetical protein [Levilactobacillus hammesii]
MSQDDHFYHQVQIISAFWKSKNLERVESLGLQAVEEGNRYPALFRILAMLYRKQHRLKEEANILKIGIERNKNNPGVARRDFIKRLARVNDLITPSKP